MTFVNIMKLWTLTTMLKAIMQIKVSGTYVFDKYFKKNAKGILGNTAKLKIKRGGSIVLKSLAKNADRLRRDTKDVYELTIELPRFGLTAEILAHEMNEFESLEGEAKVEAVSKRIKELMKEHLDDYATTIEYMSIGALFGKVIDGDGVVLFEFTTTDDPIEYKSVDHVETLDKIDDALVEELGMEVPYEILASPVFITRLAAVAKANNEFKDSGEAKWLDEDGKRILVYNSKRYIPFRASWTDEDGNTHPFVSEGEAVVIPLSTKVFEAVYGRADHTDAFKAAPQLYFASAPEKMQGGKGWSFDTEVKMIPYCARPGALIKLKFSE
ncbi:major capsid protein [Halarcobacter sp.]|uniref:major capsid protein n=1 Tax=Halarcobacter sp. TaxID=2321133 RepID=UPI0029F5C296|nr:major capsid protein [Halarcobacter sp.]